MQLATNTNASTGSAPEPAKMSTVGDLNTKLEKLASKQSVWSKQVSREEKLSLLEEAHSIFVKEFGLEGLEQLGKDTVSMKRVASKEAEYIIAEEMMMMSATAKGYLESLCEAYRARLGKSENQAVYREIPTRKVGDQVVADVFPLTPSDKAGPFQVHKGEVWFIKEQVKDETDVKPFQFDAFDESAEGGVMVILGAGNYSLLSVVDVLFAMFVLNRVVFLKHHPIRPFLEPMFRKIFAPFYTRGFLESEIDQRTERSSLIVSSPLVTKVHMTGGKTSHDAIVWGSAKEEQDANKENNTPKLTATMTSELGCVSPYIVTPTEYTAEELEHQARVLISAKWCNGSASCNAPQVVLVSENWSQREDFVGKLVEGWELAPPARTYYPGAEQRWRNFQEVYPEAKVVLCKESSSADDRHLPLLLIEIDVDLSTEEGRAKVNSEYALKNEAFTPVLIVATVRGSTTRDDFMAQAVEAANKYMYGSLSCTVIAPSSADGLPMVEKAVADLQYGAIAVNAWAGSAYLTFPLAWGGFPGETLDAVESGIGKVVNGYLLPHIEKAVLRTPTISETHFDFVHSFDDIIAGDTGFTNLVMSS